MNRLTDTDRSRIRHAVGLAHTTLGAARTDADALIRVAAHSLTITPDDFTPAELTEVRTIIAEVTR